MMFTKEPPLGAAVLLGNLPKTLLYQSVIFLALLVWEAKSACGGSSPRLVVLTFSLVEERAV
jgi:hypothetical protein